ncbi:MAG: type-F conjugative transfer system protein TraW [Legionellales bacterium RIFCSPHIGHO2_12_FULL_42_9]|nr:MAG: type-F conjugative transfer system protein TraW [Legionellales bacterium RIFCSPHIGHO2_12_FULL_42_9]
MMRFSKLFIGLLLGLGLSQTGLAKNIGNYGQVFSISEEDIRYFIMRRLQFMDKTGELARAQHDIQQRVSAHILRPTPLNLPTTTTPKRFQVDPTVIVNHDIFTPEGIRVAQKGTRLNPFEHVTFSKSLFFFDADDKAQVAWVKAHYQDYKQVKFILTGGEVSKAAEIFGRIYFDLGGSLCKRFHIEHVPSVVNQEGRLWTIQEVGVHDAS